MSALAQNWGLVVFRGVLAVLFGLIAFFLPGATVATFVVLFAVYALSDGIVSLVTAFRPPPGESRGWLVIAGVLSVLAALVAIFMPRLTAVFMFFVVAAWAIASGVAQIVAAVQLRRVVEGEWLLALAGVLSILLGVVMFARPASGLLGLLWAIAVFAVAYGVALTVLGFRLRSWQRDHTTWYGAAPAATG